ncbi:MAG TPA: molybdopterin-dependent oxidoreductase [Pirellulales bacterium]|nr:molybdopterin-dependent oxidoreductase [Pirellulales bacterium]
MPELGFPVEIRLAHWFNVLFLTLLARSGLSILSAHPKLYWNIHARPTSEWLRLTRKQLPADRMWCSTDEEAHWPNWLVLPGGEGLGLGRYWHFGIAPFWLFCGVFYVTVLFMSSQWQRLVPTSWEAVPCAWRTMVAYLKLESPEPVPPFTYQDGLPFNALQQLAYFGVVFLLTPFQILTGIAQSPSLLAQFPWFERVFGNRQGARSLHFLGLVGYAGFLAVHLTMVLWHGAMREFDKMVLGREHGSGSPLALWLGLGIISAIVATHVVATVISTYLKRPTHRLLSAISGPARRLLLHRLMSVQHYSEQEISPYFRTNGYPPISAYPQAKGDDDTYERLLANQFRDYRLKIYGLVERSLELSLEELRGMPKQEQITLHHCIQGWTSIGKWGGVRLSDILALCRPLPEARYLVFRSFGKHEKSDVPCYYECIDMKIARHSQTILAYELNDETLPVQHGAPLRPRFETKLGFKMVKFLRSIEFVADYRTVGEGMGGVREDRQQYDMGAEI